ncbi:unnamed protein product, partial [Coregonus sp. 'balchen']
MPQQSTLRLLSFICNDLKPQADKAKDMPTTPRTPAMQRFHNTLSLVEAEVIELRENKLQKEDTVQKLKEDLKQFREESRASIANLESRMDKLSQTNDDLRNHLSTREELEQREVRIPVSQSAPPRQSPTTAILIDSNGKFLVQERLFPRHQKILPRKVDQKNKSKDHCGLCLTAQHQNGSPPHSDITPTIPRREEPDTAYYSTALQDQAQHSTDLPDQTRLRTARPDPAHHNTALLDPAHHNTALLDPAHHNTVLLDLAHHNTALTTTPGSGRTLSFRE